MRVAKAVEHNVKLNELAAMGTRTTRIGAGDLLAITIASGGEEENVEPALARVAQNGNVNVPLIGEVPVADIQPFEAAERIAAAAVERDIYRRPSVVVKVEDPAVNHVTVLGAVTEPGVQKLPRGSSDLLSAIASAGGFSEEAGTEVEVMRQNSPTFMADATETSGVVNTSYTEPQFFAPPPIEPDSQPGGRSLPAMNGPQTYRLDLAQANPGRAPDYRLGDGDVVMVIPEKERVIHVSGLVNKADRFEIPRDQDVYVLDAIAMAGGIKSPVADKVYVIRRLEHMQDPAVIQVSIAKAKKYGDENLRLAPGDMVSVESTPLTNTVDTLTTFFRMSLGIGGNFATF
jgi:polysaccharide export outer membrane protein